MALLTTRAEYVRPMAFYTISPLIGPTVGPFISGFINQNANYKWSFRIFLIWIFVELAGIVLVSVPLRTMLWIVSSSRMRPAGTGNISSRFAEKEG